MAFSSGKNGRLAVDGNALAAYFSSQSFNASVDTPETTVFTSAAKEYIAGLYSGTASLDGFFSSDLNSIVVTDVFANIAGNNVTIAPAGFTVGSPTIDCVGLNTTYNDTSDVADAVKASLEFTTTGRIDYGNSLADLDTVSTTGGNGASFDGGAGSANGALAVLQVSNVTGGSVTVSVEHSTDGASWSNLATFAAASGTTSERIEVAGTVNRYLRSSWTQSASSASFAVTLSRR